MAVFPPNGGALKDLESSTSDTLQGQAKSPPTVIEQGDTSSDEALPQPRQDQERSNDVESNGAMAPPSPPWAQVNSRGTWAMSSPWATAPKNDAEVAEIMDNFFPTE